VINPQHVTSIQLPRTLPVRHCYNHIRLTRLSGHALDPGYPDPQHHTALVRGNDTDNEAHDGAQQPVHHT
jgi:hypothetical protein